jgi:predicted RNase H-like HicB family nuclease
MKYAIVIERSETGYGAYVPDLPGCIAVGETIEETESLIREAVEFHLEGLRADGVRIPEPRVARNTSKWHETRTTRSTEPPPCASHSSAPGLSDAGFAADARSRRRSVRLVVSQRKRLPIQPPGARVFS